MRFKKRIKEEFGLRQFDITPLIDVVFILIIFFMLTSSFMVQPGIKVELPKTVTHQAIKPRRVNLVVSSENIVYLNGKVSSDEDIEDFLDQNKAEIKSVFIKADKESSLGRVVQLWDICRRAGISYVNIATSDVEK